VSQQHRSLFAPQFHPLIYVLVLLGVHLCVWIIGPAYLLSNVHQDTIEIVYWSRELALGYHKHPPLAPFLVDLFLHAGRYGVLSLMLLSQTGFVITAFFCAYATRAQCYSALWFLVFAAVLLSPMAGIFGVQLNHNSVLMPAWAACLFFGFRYLRDGRWRDALGLACAGACGAWIKYEIAFVLIGLVGVAFIHKPYRFIWRRAASYVCVAVFILLLSPHLWWLISHDASPITYALETQTVAGWGILTRLNNFIVGLGVCLVGPAVVLMVMRFGGMTWRWHRLYQPEVMACALSLICLVIMSIATHQDIRQGWLVPFTPSVILALAACLRCEDEHAPVVLNAGVVMACAVAGVLMFAGFAGFVVMRAQGAKPIAAYSFDGEALSKAVAQMWSSHHSTPLACLMIDEHYMSASPLLWLKGDIRVVDFSVPAWSRPQQIAYCREHGGIIVHAHGGAEVDYAKLFPAMCAPMQELAVGARFAQGERWHFDLTRVPPAGQLCHQ
jgi:Dolichyl-phosphate-mannose-protein mannosyltransferase